MHGGLTRAPSHSRTASRLCPSNTERLTATTVYVFGDPNVSSEVAALQNPGYGTY